MQTLITFDGLKEKGHPYSREHTMRLVKAGKFPRPIRLGDGPHGRIAWIEEEYTAHLARLAARRETVAA